MCFVESFALLARRAPAGISVDTARRRNAATGDEGRSKPGSYSGVGPYHHVTTSAAELFLYCPGFSPRNPSSRRIRGRPDEEAGPDDFTPGEKSP